MSYMRNVINGYTFVCLPNAQLDAMPNVMPIVITVKLGRAVNRPQISLVTHEEIVEMCEPAGAIKGGHEAVFETFAKACETSHTMDPATLGMIKSNICAGLVNMAKPIQEKIAFCRRLLRIGCSSEELRAYVDALVALELMRLRRQTAARTIQQSFRMAVSNPHMTLCRLRLLHEWEAMCLN